MGVDDFANGNVDDRLGEGDQIRILIHVKFILQLWDIASTLEKPSEKKQQQEALAWKLWRGHSDLASTC